jgi:hypothetical protein
MKWRKLQFVLSAPSDSLFTYSVHTPSLPPIPSGTQRDANNWTISELHMIFITYFLILFLPELKQGLGLKTWYFKAQDVLHLSSFS